MTDMRTWAFRSPKRLALLVAVPIAAVVAVGGLLSLRGDGRHGTDALSTAPSPAVSVPAEVPNAQPFVAAAVNFVRVWARLAPGQTSEQWHDAVRALATPDLAATLNLTNTSTLPGATPSGSPQVRFIASTSALISVPLSNGTSVVATIVLQEDNTWLVDDIEPDTGN